MKAVVLAAGMNSRIGDVEAGNPKPLFRLGNSTMIEKVLTGLSKTSVTEIIIVTGYKGKKIRDKIGNMFGGKSIKYVYNSNYRHSSNIYSLLVTQKYIDDGLVFTNADSILEEPLYRKVVSDDRKNLILIDGSGEKLSEDDPVKVRVDKKGLITLIGKKMDEKLANGVAVGLYKFSQEASKKLFRSSIEILKDQKVRGGYLLSVRKVLEKFQVEPYYTEDMFWYDIDTPEEYQYLVNKYKEKE